MASAPNGIPASPGRKGGSASRARALLAGVGFTVLAALMISHARAYYWLCDDAYISLRFVRNFIEGWGLVYNAGEYVEGYTNFFWVLHLAALWRFMGIGPETGATVLSAIYTLGVCGLCTWFAASGLTAGKRLWVAWSALLLLAISRTFAVWSTSGLETRQFTFFVVLSIVMLSRYPYWRRAPIYASLALAAAEYSRPEGLLIAAVCVIDALGLCDREIARLRVNLRNSERLMAHEHWGRISRDYLRSRGMNIDIGPAARCLTDTFDAEFVLRIQSDLWMRLDDIDPALPQRFGREQSLLRWSVVRVVADFKTPESLLSWERHAEALENNPQMPTERRPGMQGNGLLSTWHAVLGDRAIGYAVSAPFNAPSDSYLCFSIAGGADETTGVSLLAGERVLETWHGNNSATLRPIAFRLTDYSSQSLRLRVFDESTAGWGHVDVDEIVIRAPRPVLSSTPVIGPARDSESGSSP